MTLEEQMKADAENATKKIKNELSALVKKEYDDAQASYAVEKNRRRERENLAVQEELRRGRVSHKDPRSGQDVTYQDELDAQAKNLINEGQRAYDDWRSCMMALLSMFSLLTKVVHQAIAKEIIIGKGSETFRNKVIQPAKDRLMDLIKGEPKLHLPTLEHHVAFKEGKVETAALTRADGGELNSQELNDAFKNLVKVWLFERGYVERPSPREGEFFDQAGVNLTEAEFNAFNADPDTSFATFLGQNTELQFQSSPSP